MAHAPKSNGLAAGTARDGAPNSGDALALALFDQLLAASAADRRVVWRALAGRLVSSGGKSDRGVRAEHARRSIHACAEDLGRVPSVKEYRAWRKKQADPREWTSDKTIREMFLGWKRALDQCGLAPAADVTAGRLLRSGVPYTSEQVIDAIRSWRQDRPADPMTWVAYHRYAVETRSAHAAQGRRLPCAVEPFFRCFGTWRDAISAAGFTPAGGRRRARWRGPGTAYTDESILRDLRECADALQVPRVSEAQFRAWADKACEADPLRTIPCSRTIADRFGGWPAAQTAAGLASAPTDSPRSRPGGTMTNNDALDLDDAAAARGQRPTDVGFALARLVPALSEQTAKDLMRLLSHRIAAPTSAEIRQARLGLMLDVISPRTGEFVPVDVYEAARKERIAQGEDWPAASTLILAYGDWISVVELSFRLWRDGTSSGVPHSTHHQRKHTPPYRRQDITDALRRCRTELGGWPSQQEYYEWARVSRDLSRRAGQPTDRFPGRGPIRKLFGDFDQALSSARRQAGEPEQSAGAEVQAA